MESEPTGLVVDEECGGFNERHDIGDFQNGVGFSVSDFGIATAVQAFLGNHREYAVSRRKPARVRRRLDLTSHLGSRYEGQVTLYLVGAANLKQVEEVDGGCADTNPDELLV